MVVSDGARPCCKAMVLAVVGAVLLSSCGGCASQSTSSPSTAVAASLESNAADSARKDASLSGREVLPVDERIVLSDGIEDSRNQFAFAVMVSASPKTGETLKCTGTLVSPQVILTAGHCVCARRPSTNSGNGAMFVIDGSACADEATITTVTYHPQEGGQRNQPRIEAASYLGKARPHPRMRVLLDAQSAVISSDADLAVVVLEDTARGLPVPITPADTEVNVGEVVLTAGYGFDATTDLIHGVRRFGQKRVIKTPENGNDEVLFEAYGGDFTSGSGEPCMRKQRDGASLIGISSKGPGATTVFTSLYPHRDWLASEIHRAGREKATEGGTPTQNTP